MRGLWLTALLALASCVDAVSCGPFTEEVDGACVGQVVEELEPGESAFYEALSGLSPCVPAEGEVQLDLQAGCAGDACVGADAQALLDAHPDAECRSEGGLLSCDIGEVRASVVDADWNGEPDDGAVVRSLQVLAPGKRTDDGLGVGASMSCFLDVLPEPDLVAATQQDGEWVLRELYWSEGVRVGNYMLYTRDLAGSGDWKAGSATWIELDGGR